MFVVKKPFGHYHSRSKIRDANLIKFQKLVASARNNEDAAAISIVAEALEGKGPLGPALKKASKDLVAKFTKQNPGFQFKPIGRAVGTKNPAGSAKPGPKPAAPAKKETAKAKTKVKPKAKKK